MKKSLIITVLIAFVISLLFIFLFLDNKTPVKDIKNVKQEETNSPSEKKSDLPDWIEVYFSDTYKNDYKLSEQNLENIDKKLSEKLFKAKKSIYAALHELDSEIITNALISSFKNGVDVKIVTETDYIEEDSIKHLKKEGIPIVSDEGRSALMHNKFIIIDGEYVWTGSFNTTYNGANKNNNNAVYIKSKELAENYTNEFNEMFENKEFGITSDKSIINPLVKMNNGEIISLFAPENSVDEDIINEINKSQKEIRFMAFSFTHDEIAKAMINKFENGIDVKGIFEKRGAKSPSSEYGKMLKKGIDVKLDGNKYICHHKVIIIDGKTTLTGSFNFSENATKTNDENLLIIRNEDVAKKFLDEFEKLDKLANLELVKK